MNYAPIALFVFRRLAHARETVSALSRNDVAAESELFIFSDAPKEESQQAEVKRVREYCQSIRGFRKIEIIEREQNYGLYKNVTSGVTQLVGQYGSCIVLEDDLITSPVFLKYMNDALNRYENNPEVMQIAGYMFDADLDNEENDAIFLPFITSWGWGTWKRAWDNFDPTLNGYEEIRTNAALRHRFNLNGAYNYSGLLELQKNGKDFSWDIRWYLSVFMKNGLALYPKKNLVSNSGFDGSGEHCQAAELRQQSIQSSHITRFPTRIAESPNSGKVYQAIRKQFGLCSRVLRRLSTYLKKK